MNRKPAWRLLTAIAALGVLAGAALFAAACGGDDDDDDADSSGGQTSQQTTTPAPAASKLTIADAWARTTTNDVSAAYMVVKNTGEADTLIKATANVSPMVQLHEVVTEGASSKMQEKPGGFPVPANGELVLKPGGFHIMLMNLKTPLKEGDTVELELTFEKAGTIKVSAPVKPAAGASADMGGMGGGGMHGSGTTTMATPTKAP